MYPYNFKKGQTIQTDASGVRCDRSFLAHIAIAAADAPAASADGVLAAANLGVEAQEIATGIRNPAVPRGLSIVGNVSGIIGNVVITGENYAGAIITETIALDGTTTKKGAKAFAKVTKIALPVQSHTPVNQVETATAAGKVTAAGNAVVTVKSILFEADEVVAVPVELNDTANEIAAAIRAALEANEVIAAHFDVSGEASGVILTAKVPAANDDTLNIAITDGTGDGASVGVTTAASSADTTAGVPHDTVSVGWSDVLGLPYKLGHNTVLAVYLDNVLESSAATITTSKTAIEANTVKLSSSLAGKAVDVYLIV